MNLPFNEEKAVQVAGSLLRLSDGRESYLKLIKLLYFLDRAALLRWGRTVTTDRFVSMPHGPVVSRIYDLICSGPEPTGAPSPWHRHIQKDSYDVTLGEAVANTELSRAEERLIAEIHAQYAGLSKWQMRDLSHSLPEWQDPQGSSIPIEIVDILRAEHRTEAEIAAIDAELRNVSFVHAL